MADPIRLHRLIDLRETAGLTLADMAQHCGLHGSQSRKTVSAWETGTAIPRASRRIRFVRYLWHDLHLHQKPTLFDEIWAMLVEEWGWEPLSGAERVQLLVAPTLQPLTPEPITVATEAAEIETEEPAAESVAPEGIAQEFPSVPVEPVPSVPTLTADALLLAAAPPLAPPLTAPEGGASWLAALRARWHWALIAIPLLLLGVAGRVWWGMADVDTPSSSAVAMLNGAGALPTEVATTVAATEALSIVVTVPSEVLTPTAIATPTLPIDRGLQADTNPLTLLNDGFDQPEHFAGWNVLEECDYQIISDETVAQGGDRYLSIHNRRPRCYSFYQDLYTPLDVGVTYRAAIWLRSPLGQTRRGRFRLWALPNPPHGDGDTPFAVDNTAWTCLETTVTIEQPTHDHLRFEVYLDSHDGVEYQFDSALLSQGETSLCPAPQPMLVDLQLAQPSGQFYAGSTAGIEAQVKNIGPTDLTQGIFIRY